MTEPAVLEHTDLAGNLALITSEIADIIDRLDIGQAEPLVRLIQQADRIFVVGAGRSGLVLKMAAMRLMHLGLTVHVVGESTTPAIGPGDLLIAASGSGTTSSVVHAAATAARVGAKVASYTTTADAALASLSDRVFIIPAAQKTDHRGTLSRQYSGSLFEQALLITTEAVFQTVWDLHGVPADELWPRHANLE
ncbi:6-phospho-3-hexuloisomerase [Micrococcaceae bacterium Sec5.7]